MLTAGTDQNSNQLTNVTAINAGTHHTCALLSTGAMQCWGYNASRQLGDGTTTTRLNPVTVTGGHSFGSDATAPTFVSAAVNTAGTKVILTYSEALSATTADASAFSILVGGSSRSVSSVAVSGSTVELSLASAVATGLSSLFPTNLVYCFEKKGVLLDINNADSVIPIIDSNYYQTLKANQQIFAGMIPKLDNAFAAVKSGVKQVIICHADELQAAVTHGTISVSIAAI